MKRFSTYFIVALLVGSVSVLWAQSANQSILANIPAPTPNVISQQDGNSRVWGWTTYEQSSSGETVSKKHGYIELATGLNHLVGNQWVESTEDIVIQPDGTAAATNGQHQVYFPADIYNGVIELVTSGGQHLKSQPAALSYDDGTNSVLIAVLTNSIGYLADSNRVIYPNAFVGVNADLCYTYTKAGFEQDVILREQPPAPAAFNLDPDATKIQVLTEFFNPPQPGVTTAIMLSSAGKLVDNQLNFAGLQLGRGRAFSLGGNSSSVRVYKQWTRVDGRQFLVEEVPTATIAVELESLPLPAQQVHAGALSSGIVKHLVLPPPHLVKGIPTAKPMRLAKAPTSTRGLVLDYVAISGNTNYMFRADTTYYISSALHLTGASIVEGGAVIKCIDSGLRNNTAIDVGFSGNGSITSKTGPYRMVVFTSKNDNSVGEVISGSTGNPTNNGETYLEFYLGTTPSTLAYWRFAYAGVAVEQSSVGSGSIDANPIRDCQFMNCATAIGLSDYDNITVLHQKLYNVLFSHCGAAVANMQAEFYASQIQLIGQNITADLVTNMLMTYTNDFLAGSSSLTNSILTSITHQIYKQENNTSQNFTYTNACLITSNGSAIYQTVGAGNYYLVNNSYRNLGNGNIDPTLLAELKQKTTYPPVIYSNVTSSFNTTLSPQAQRDTDVPDLGYHYDPIDYIADRFNITNAVLTMTNGTVMASYNNTGVGLQDGSSIVSIGTPAYPNWFIRYQSVQEQPISLDGANNGGIDVFPIYAGVQPSGSYRFTKFVCPAGGGEHLYASGNSSYNNLAIQDCEFWGGVNYFGSTNSTVTTIKNSFFARSTVNAAGPGSLSFTNNLAWGASFVQLNPSGTGVWYAFNNEFDTCIITNSILTNGYNAYLGGSGRLSPTNSFDIVSTNAFVYQTGPLGAFYQPTNSALINNGNTTANLVGLFHYTVTTNEVAEGAQTVSIGYHYVATDVFGNPLDTDGDGSPNYLEDANGNGLVDGGENSWTNYNSAAGLTSGNGLLVFTPLK